jgi:hypothetical protein
MFENRVFRRITHIGPKREEVAGDWRRLHSEEVHILYTSPNIIRIIKLRMIRWVGNVAHMEEMKNEYKILVGKPEGKRPHIRQNEPLGSIKGGKFLD